jgi:pantetheine-phosphate adenylyltransferase
MIIGIYAGSFDPFHIGHLNIYQKSLRIFDEVIVAMGVNPEKGAQEEMGKRCFEISRKINAPVMHFNGLLTSFIKDIKRSRKEAKIVLIRGLRNGDDLDYEINQLRFMEELDDIKVDIVFIPCDKEFEHISSTAIRNIKKLNPKLAKKYTI